MNPWQNSPFKISVKAGDTLAFCLCGQSRNGPYCDGSHASTDIKPQVIKYDQDQNLFACGCLRSANRPFCDGTHTRAESCDAPETP